jgi:esterase FrsA
MTSTQPKHFSRTYPEARELLLERARKNRNPFDNVSLPIAQAILDRLDSLDREPWAAIMSEAAEPHYAAAVAAEAAGDPASAAREYLDAFGLLRAARYPAPNSPLKKAAYRRSQDAYLALARLAPQHFERVEIPYAGTQAQGATIPAYFWLAKGRGPLALVITWGGIDSFKEDRVPDPFLDAGFAFLAMDMPGVGDAPIPGSEHGEELWDGVFNWIETRSELDPRRIIVYGASTGGYWATKLAHTHRDRLAGAINHGGPAHFAFTPDWIARSAHGEYPFELAETLACAFGRETAAEWIDYAPRLSLLDQGILDRPCAPLLCINGIKDSVFPIEDMYLLLQHGTPKSSRFFPSGHMGSDPQMMPTIMTWLQQFGPAR